MAYDVSADSVAELEKQGATGATTLEDFVAALQPLRMARVMIPAAITREVVSKLAGMMSPGDIIIIDGGNSNYREDIDRDAALKPLGIHYVDAGTSGGVFELDCGYCLLIGGEPEVVEYLHRIAPGLSAAHAGTHPSAGA